MGVTCSKSHTHTSISYLHKHSSASATVSVFQCLSWSVCAWQSFMCGSKSLQYSHFSPRLQEAERGGRVNGPRWEDGGRKKQREERTFYQTAFRFVCFLFMIRGCEISTYHESHKKYDDFIAKGWSRGVSWDIFIMTKELALTQTGTHIGWSLAETVGCAFLSISPSWQSVDVCGFFNQLLKMLYLKHIKDISVCHGRKL